MQLKSSLVVRILKRLRKEKARRQAYSKVVYGWACGDGPEFQFCQEGRFRGKDAKAKLEACQKSNPSTAGCLKAKLCVYKWGFSPKKKFKW